MLESQWSDLIGSWTRPKRRNAPSFRAWRWSGTGTSGARCNCWGAPRLRSLSLCCRRCRSRNRISRNEGSRERRWRAAGGCVLPPPLEGTRVQGKEEGKDIDRGHALDAGKWQLPTAVRFPTSSEGLEILLATWASAPGEDAWSWWGQGSAPSGYATADWTWDDQGQWQNWAPALSFTLIHILLDPLCL